MIAPAMSSPFVQGFKSEGSSAKEQEREPSAAQNLENEGQQALDPEKPEEPEPGPKPEPREKMRSKMSDRGKLAAKNKRKLK
jgi:hypothetical protein